MLRVDNDLGLNLLLLHDSFDGFQAGPDVVRVEDPERSKIDTTQGLLRSCFEVVPSTQAVNSVPELADALEFIHEI